MMASDQSVPWGSLETTTLVVLDAGQRITGLGSLLPDGPVVPTNPDSEVLIFDANRAYLPYSELVPVSSMWSKVHY